MPDGQHAEGPSSSISPLSTAAPGKACAIISSATRQESPGVCEEKSTKSGFSESTSVTREIVS